MVFRLQSYKKNRKKQVFTLLLSVFYVTICIFRAELLSVVLARYCQFLTSLCTTCIEYTTAILCCHSLTEAVLVHSSSVVRLKCSFHCLCLFYDIIFTLWAAKLLISF